MNLVHDVIYTRKNTLAGAVGKVFEMAFKMQAIVFTYINIIHKMICEDSIIKLSNGSAYLRHCIFH